MPPQFSDLLKELREARSLTKADLARATGAVWTTVHTWEERGGLPSQDSFDRILDALRLSEEERGQLEQAWLEAWERRPIEARMPRDVRKRRGKGEPRRQAPVPPQAPVAHRETRAADWERLVLRSVDPDRHGVRDVDIVVGALVTSGADPSMPDAKTVARRLLDAAVGARASGLSATASGLCVALAQSAP